MAVYEGICKLTNRKEKIWIEMIPAKTLDEPFETTIGLMLDCTVHREIGINICKDRPVYNELYKEL